MRFRTLVVVALLPLAYAVQTPDSGRLGAQRSNVEVRHTPQTQQVVVSVAGRPFTTYRYGADFPDKPVFYPVLSPNGARVNREYPMVTGVAGESADHPHHQSMWFSYDEVNGTNFWNTATTGRRIEHLDMDVSGDALTARLAWKDKDGAVVLEETKHVMFGGGADVAWMDHDITLAATRVPVSMGDTKEGTLGIRLNDTLKEQGGTGRYINAEGLETEKGVWGKTSDWVAIRGTIPDPGGAKEVSVAIFAPRSGLNAPPYWHARAYGLFAVNPFGRKAFDPSQPERITRLAVGDQVRTRFRLAVYTGQVTPARLAQDYAAIR
jgi:hypothetical protein